MHGTASSRSSDANPARDGAEDEGWKIVDDDEGGSNAAKLASVSCNASMDVDTIAVPAVSDELEGLQPVIEIAFKNGMWWCLPEALSKAIYETSLAHDVVSYIWDWGDRRPGSWKLVQWDGSEEKTSINRYVLDFGNKTQTNIDNGRLRSFRVVYTKDVSLAEWNGEIPSTK